MGEKEDKEKAEKLAAAKKRVAQLQKKKKAAAGSTDKPTSSATGSKTKDKAKDKKDEKEKEEDEVLEAEELEAQHETTEPANEVKVVQQDQAVETQEDEEEDEDAALFNAAIRSAAAQTSTSPGADDSTSIDAPKPRYATRQPSISVQSQLRSSSFRQAADGSLLSPSASEFDEGASSAESMYRKQTLRIEDLEKENKRLVKEAGDGEARWRKSEEELEELRENMAATERNSSQGQNSEIEQLRSEITSLRRSQRASMSGAPKTPTAASFSEGSESLRKEMEGKDSTISDLQLEISRLRSQISAQTEGCETHGEQISALQSSVERSEARVKKLETELGDTKKALSRASEKAVVDTTERTSKETKIRNLEKENDELKTHRDELNSKIEGLEKKVDAMNKLHRETEARSSSKLTTVEAQAREAQMLRNKTEGLEKEIVRLREARKQTMSGGGNEDDLDELEDEERKKLEKQIRDLESENFDLKRGVWRDRRRELQPGMQGDADGNGEGDEFDEVDLTTSAGPGSRTRSFAAAPPASQAKHSGFTQVLNSGLAAFRSGTLSPDSQSRARQQSITSRPRNDSLLQDFDGDDDDLIFDERAFAQAQREEEMKKMVEHVREVKRGLKQWVGWRLDLVDARRGGGGWGVGEIFDI